MLRDVEPRGKEGLGTRAPVSRRPTGEVTTNYH